MRGLVHSTEDFRSASFAISVAGAPAALEDVLPGFGALDRLGIVVRTPGGATGASLLVLAAVTAFYDRQRALADEFFAYPDYFCFHVGAPRGEHGMLDVWPPHKEVVVPAGEPEELLRAVNDRGVTRLVVAEGAPSAPAFEPETLASARARIVTALAYAPHGRAAGADVEIAGNDASESYVAKLLESDGVGAEAAAALTTARAALRRDDGRPVEAYRRIGLDEALALLCAAA